MATVVVSFCMVVLIFIAPDPFAWCIVPLLVFLSLVVLFRTLGKTQGRSGEPYCSDTMNAH